MKNKFLLSLGLLSLAFVHSCESSANAEAIAQEEQEFNYGQTIDSIIAQMTIEQKVGQMTQINLDVISEGEIFALKEPHRLDSSKLDSAINHYYVGSVLNVGGHTYDRNHWKDIIIELQTKAISEGNRIPIIYGIDAIHGVNYTAGSTLFPQQIGQAATWNP